MRRASVCTNLIAAAFAAGTFLLTASNASAQAVAGTEAGAAIAGARKAGNAVDAAWSGLPRAYPVRELCLRVRTAWEEDHNLWELHERAVAAGQFDLAQRLARTSDELEDFLDEVEDDVDCWAPFGDFAAFNFPGMRGGFYISAGVGGGGSRPSTEDLSGSGSGFTLSASVGYRQRFSEHTWGALNFGIDWLSNDEAFPPPFDDLKVRPGVIFHQSAELGVDFPGSAPGQLFAPYLAIGVAEANIKVSTPSFSDTQFNLGPVIGGGFDYRINTNWLVHTNVSTYFFSHSYQFEGGAPFTLDERVTTGVIGLSYQF